MNRLSVKIAAMIGALSFAQPALADCNNTATNRLCTDVRITQLTTSDDGASGMQISGNVNNLTCTPPSGRYLNIDMSRPYAESMYAHILSAHLQGKQISIRLSDHIAECTVVYVFSDN